MQGCHAKVFPPSLPAVGLDVATAAARLPRFPCCLATRPSSISRICALLARAVCALLFRHRRQQLAEDVPNHAGDAQPIAQAGRVRLWRGGQPLVLQAGGGGTDQSGQTVRG